MYFQIENTPEHIRRARRTEVTRKEEPKEECPRLIIAPFSKPPQVVFENVLIGSSCERNLEILNPSKQAQQITLGRSLPPGLVIHLPGEWLYLEPETCYCLTMMWSPLQPTAMRETIRFTNENRGRYDVIVVLKSVMNIKGKGKHSKPTKISPGKVKKKAAKKSPVGVNKRKAEVIYNTTKVRNTGNVVHSNQHKTFKLSDKENISVLQQSVDLYPTKCPFDSPASFELNFNTSEIFSGMRKPNNEMLQETYDKTYETRSNYNFQPVLQQNILKPSNKQQFDTSGTDMFDNLTFTPLKTLQAVSKSDKLEKGPKIIMSLNSDTDFDDSLDIKGSNKENETHSIICVTSSQPPNKWLSVNHSQHEHQNMETPTLQNKKIPNTSSPKEMNSPNFSINTDFSRISDLSFFPQRFSTERKVLPKINNETHEFINDTNPTIKLSSDTFTKDSPNTVPDHQMVYENRHPFFIRDHYPKLCRQSLFKESQQFRDNFERNYVNYEQNLWHSDLRADRSPPRSLTPPLQSIPEESGLMSDTQTLDNPKRQQHTFTINRTFDKTMDKSSSILARQSWSKKALRAEPDLWKVPVPLPKKAVKAKAPSKSKDSISGKLSNTTYEANKSINQNVSFNQVGNVYSQSLTVDPFLSSTYFYDEEAVEKFETEFKRWLNYILTPPADLDSNVEMKIDVGKAWIENRNKEIPAAPTKEQVCSKFHNSHRLESLRRSARVLLVSADISQVFVKLNVQIEKKLIAIRNDRNLHLDVGLQKIIMELLLSYNPLWLRIGLEAIYGLVLPLKSNSDIEGLTTFIIQRMFKNPHLKNKHSKSSAPNMLLPAYMEAIKKFTLKKFFMLVFFLDQAKQKKLISHDPCLFCRNAVCKESREIVIRFTRELIAGIGDITKHLRPLGYVVSHKQSYLDEYKYAVHNIAIDIRDGVRLTKVMEIILLKNGIVSQLRTPAISRLQKIHNVQVAMTALKEANFTIVGDITATDIADGHREKTLSLLWQLIHVFRAPLFVKAANVIQTWWRRKYAIIIEERRKEAELRQRLDNAASAIQLWWRRIQYNRMVELRFQQLTCASVTIQKYFRRWSCRNRFVKIKNTVVAIENWYYGVKKIREAREILNCLRLQREERKRRAVIKIQAYVRRWITSRRYEILLKKVILVQSVVRCYSIRVQYLRLKKSVSYIQEKYRGKLLMRQEMKNFAAIVKSAVTIQSYFRMVKQRRQFLTIKRSVRTIGERYKALLEMRRERNRYLRLKHAAVRLQAIFRGNKCHRKYKKQRNIIVNVQRRIRAHRMMLQERSKYLKIKMSAVTIQRHVRAFLSMKKQRTAYLAQRNSAIFIQRCFRTHQIANAERAKYLQLRKASISLQIRYRSLIKMRQARNEYVKLRNAAVVLQRRYRALATMRICKNAFLEVRNASILIQRRYRAQVRMREEWEKFLKMKHSCVVIQNAFRAYVKGKQQRQAYLRLIESVVKIQGWYRALTKGIETKKQYMETKQACLTIQRRYKAYIVGRTVRHEFIRIKTATICIQKYYKNYLITKRVRQEFNTMKTCSITIQRFYRSYIETTKQRQSYLKLRTAAIQIQHYYRRYKETQRIRQRYIELRTATIRIQGRYRALLAMRTERVRYLKLKHAAINVQKRYRALITMRLQRQSYSELRLALITIQRRFRAQIAMKKQREEYLTIIKACKVIQRRYRAYKIGREQLNEYLKLKTVTIKIQQKYRALLTMRRVRTDYSTLKSTAVFIQRKFRANKLMATERTRYKNLLKAAVLIQSKFRAHILAKKVRENFLKLKFAAIVIQTHYRGYIQTKKTRSCYVQYLNTVKYVQRHIRARNALRTKRREEAARTIQIWYNSTKLRNKCRSEYLDIRRKVIIIQSVCRMHIKRKQYVQLRSATIALQRCYRSYRLATNQRQNYIKIRSSIVRLQAHVRCLTQRKRFLRIRSAVVFVQVLYRFKKHMQLTQERREYAALCIQRNIRCYLTKKWYSSYIQHVRLIQQLWRGKLQTRLTRWEFLFKRQSIIKLQSIARGYLVRRKVEHQKETLRKLKEERRRNWAASKIQALFRGHLVRVNTKDHSVNELRRRWRDGALKSTQASLKERNEEAMIVLRNFTDIEAVIRAFRSLDILTEVIPMMYESNASSVVSRVYVYMSVTNRSISSVEVLKSAASMLVNLTRYKVTGPNVYKRDRIPPTLKFMWRFSNSETQLFCILCTYLWLFSKYKNIKEDLAEYLHTPENHKMLVTIKGNVDRMKRMTLNVAKNRFHTPQPSKFISHTNNQSFKDSMNHSLCNTSNASNNSIVLPSLEPDYGIVRADKPRYFEDAHQAISCLFKTYNL